MSIVNKDRYHSLPIAVCSEWSQTFINSLKEREPAFKGKGSEHIFSTNEIWHFLNEINHTDQDTAYLSRLIDTGFFYIKLDFSRKYKD